MNIFLIAFEGESYFIGKLAQSLKQSGHSVFIFNCDHYTVTHMKGEVYEYYKNLGLTSNEFTNLEDVFEELNGLEENSSQISVDMNFIKEFEKKYCTNWTLHALLHKDSTLSHTYHHRDIYYHPKNKIIYYKFLEIALNKIQKIFVNPDFDFVFTIRYQYFYKALIYQVSQALKIPYFSLFGTRINDIHYIYNNLCWGTPIEIKQEMNRLKSTNNKCPEAEKYIDKMLSSQMHPYSSFSSTWDNIKNNLTFSSKIILIGRNIRYTLKSSLFVWNKYSSWGKRDYFLPTWWSYMKTLCIASYRSILYQRDNQLNHSKLPHEPFIYFAMHLIPESNTLTLSKTLDEMECIFQLSKVLPVGWKIVVKINPYMLTNLDTHPNSYYQRINTLPNVIFINPLYLSSDIVKKCSAVASLCGTVLLEGLIHGKPAFRWGEAEFTDIEGIYEFNSDTFQDNLNKTLHTDVKYYIQSFFNLGISLNLNYLISTNDTSVNSYNYLDKVELIKKKLIALVSLPAKSCIEKSNVKV
ncbi:hypothetical protein [Calothrix rhizosoleniae]|uniref:hypothetical protein n=1 Tax=Calothrix rhizosoleniae TaxID=888997 RepID=UPI000B49EC0B|nr:hypothetical protein [Calothrix rhizosoleniae]